MRTKASWLLLQSQGWDKETFQPLWVISTPETSSGGLKAACYTPWQHSPVPVDTHSGVDWGYFGRFSAGLLAARLLHPSGRCHLPAPPDRRFCQRHARRHCEGDTFQGAGCGLYLLSIYSQSNLKAKKKKKILTQLEET